MRRRGSFLVFLAAVSLACVSCVSSRSPASGLYVKARAASVDILVDGRQEGSGWFASEDGCVVTAAHVVRGASNNVEVLWAAGTNRMPAGIVALDKGHDLALLRVAKRRQPYPFLAAAATMPGPGEQVYLYGTALFVHDIILGGMVARGDCTFNYYGGLSLSVRCYHVTAPSPPGTSGGPWVDARGTVVGNQSGFINQEKAGSGIAVVTPPDAICRLVAQKKTVATASMGCGFEELWSQQKGYTSRFPAGTEGLVTIPIEPGRAADKAGLNKESVILKFDGIPVRYRDEAYRLIRQHKPGDRITLSVLDPDTAKPHDVILVLGELE